MVVLSNAQSCSSHSSVSSHGAPCNSAPWGRWGPCSLPAAISHGAAPKAAVHAGKTPDIARRRPHSGGGKKGAARLRLPLTWHAGPSGQNDALPSLPSMSERSPDEDAAAARAEGREVAQRAATPVGLDELATPLLQDIFMLLPLDARACLAATCRRLRAIAEAQALWQVLDFGTVRHWCPPLTPAALAALLARAARHGGPCELSMLPAPNPRRPAVACRCSDPWAGMGPCVLCKVYNFAGPAVLESPPVCRRLAGGAVLAALRDSGAGANLLRLRAGEAHAFAPGDAAALAAACPRLRDGELVLLEEPSPYPWIHHRRPPGATQLPPGMLTQRCEDPARQERNGCLVVARAKTAFRPEEATLLSLRRAALNGTATSLNLSSCELHTGASVLATLQELPQFAALRCINLCGNRIANGASLWRELGRLPLLESLDVGNNPLGRTGAAALAEGVLLRAGGAAGGAAAQNPLAPLLRLDANGCELCDGGVAELARALPHLAALGVQRNYVGDGGAAAITSALQQCAPAPLETLNLADNHLSSLAVCALAAALGAGCAPELARLDLHGSVARDQGAEALAAALCTGNLPRLRALLLGNNLVGRAGAAALRDAAGACPELRGGKLDLHDNPCCERGGSSRGCRSSRR